MKRLFFLLVFLLIFTTVLISPFLNPALAADITRKQFDYADPAEKSFKLNVNAPNPTPKPMAKPEAPILEYPVGRYLIRGLGFYWAPSKNAENYTVNWRDDRGHSGTLKLSNNDASCQGGRCIAYTILPGEGHYTWDVTASNSAGEAKSKEMQFEIVSNISTPNPYLPNGTIINRNYPAFQWEDVRDGAVEYRIQVVGKYDNRIRFDRFFSVNEIYVGNGVCWVQTDLFLPAGAYSWRVQARNDEFSSGWSYWLDFYVECDYCSYGGAYYNTYANTVPTTSYPTGTITTLTPEFQWRTLTGASYYTIQLYNDSGTLLFDNQVSNTVCTAELCTWDPSFTLPGNGNYTWTVNGFGANGGRWGTASGSFIVCPAIVMNPMSFRSPQQNGYLSRDMPVIIWTDPGDTTVIFRVDIYDAANNNLLTTDLSREGAWCDGMTCSIEFANIPDGGNYRIVITPFSELNTQGDPIELVFSKSSRPLMPNFPKEGSAVRSRPMLCRALDAGESVTYELTL